MKSQAKDFGKCAVQAVRGLVAGGFLSGVLSLTFAASASGGNLLVNPGLRLAGGNLIEVDLAPIGYGVVRLSGQAL